MTANCKLITDDSRQNRPPQTAHRDLELWHCKTLDIALSPELKTTPEGEIITLQINEVPLKPVATRGRCYRRAGSTTHVMSPAEIAAMHLASTGQSMDAMIVERKTCDDLDMEAVRRYMHKATAQRRRSFTDQDDPWQVLQKLELVKSETEITRAAILLFGKNPQSATNRACRRTCLKIPRADSEFCSESRLPRKSPGK